MTNATPLIRDPRNALEPTPGACAGGEQTMVRYFYAWIPLVVVFGTAIIMTIPYLAVIVLMAVLLAVVAAVAAFVWATFSALYGLARSAFGRTIPHAASAKAAPSPQHGSGVLQPPSSPRTFASSPGS